MKTKNQEVDKEIKKSRKWQTEVKKFAKENKVEKLTNGNRKWKN